MSSKASYDNSYDTSTSFLALPPPSFQEAIASLSREDTLQLGTLPPDYHEISLIPPQTILLRQNVPSITSSTASFERTKEGVTSCDEKLQKNEDELYKFFITHLAQRPGLFIHIEGTHNNYAHRDTRLKKDVIVDFSLTVDASHYVHQHWESLFALQKRSSKPQAFHEVLEEYTHSKNPFKEIHLVKQIPWDFRNLRAALKSIIRRTGYSHHLQITFSYPKSSIKVSKSNVMKMGGAGIVAQFGVGVDAGEFFGRNVEKIMEMVTQGSKGVILRAL
ncbi:hypothetical protein BC829DRAFT_388028 [Chytridium lagenaria]|nr:hypothetical protein BC829DRAFT_388028 [Chytridium lagenaria]